MHVINRIKTLLIDYYWMERKICRGFENPDKTFYVIRRKSREVGLFSYVCTNLGLIEYAINNNYIPVIDMQTRTNPYRRKKGENAWEYYFEQPCGVTLEDIKHSKNVVLSSGEIPESFPGLDMLDDLDRIEFWNSLSQQYVRLNERTQRYIKMFENQLWGNEGKDKTDNSNTLGVLIRGTDYLAKKPGGHPIQPSLEQITKKIDDLDKVNHYDKIYLATEDKDILAYMKKEFGDKLIFPDINLREYVPGELISMIELDIPDDCVNKGRDYLMQIALLAKCDDLLAAGCGGTYGALLLTKGYKHLYLLNLGLY